MRLFLALETPPEVQQELGRRMRALEDRLPPARWVRPEGIHLTLHFLGETEPSFLDGLGARMPTVFARHPRFAVQTEGGGTFPPSRPARVAWTGLQGVDPDGVAALAALQREVAAAACEVTGSQPDGKPFHPHLTLARPAAPWPRAEAERFAAAFAGPIGPAFRVRRGVLMDSETGRGGSRYRVVQEYPLGEVPG